MSAIWYVIIFSLVGGAVSLTGGFLLLANKRWARQAAEYATPFAAGALLAAAFVDLLPEATHNGSSEHALLAALAGIIGFFLLERFLRWFHHHHEHDQEADPNIWLIIIGDILHNLIDGVAIAAAFLVSIPTGIVATLAVAAHEIPQEIGDFGLLLKKGMRRRDVVIVNALSALVTTVAAVLFFILGQQLVLPLEVILGAVAGFFVYIAVSDIIPSIHAAEEQRIAGLQTFLLVIGTVIVGLTTTYAHNFIDTGHDPEHHHEEAAEHHD